VIVYVDTRVSSVRSSARLRRSTGATGTLAYASEILGVEARRAIDRLRLNAALDDAGVEECQQELSRIEQFIGCVQLTQLVLRRASLPMSTFMRTLDAVHLASVLILQERNGEELVFATHDSRQAMGARALGFNVVVHPKNVYAI
jgi:hypothetical protein